MAYKCMDINNKMAIFVLSCDKYQDVWDEFFNLKDRYWKDSNFQWYLVTESVIYNRPGVITLNSEGNWSTRYRNAVNSVKAKYICSYLDDYFITDTIDNDRINHLVGFMEENKVSFLNMDDGFDHIQCTTGLKIYSDGFVEIPRHMPYGVDTAGAIWDREYLLEKLGEGDYSAWQFELERCNEAKTKEGLSGKLLLEQKQSLNICKIPVIIQGAYYPPAIRFFKKKGYNINCHNRRIMSQWDVFVYWLKRRCSKSKYGRKFLKWVGTHFFGLEFVSKN